MQAGVYRCCACVIGLWERSCFHGRAWTYMHARVCPPMCLRAYYTCTIARKYGFMGTHTDEVAVRSDIGQRGRDELTPLHGVCARIHQACLRKL